MQSDLFKSFESKASSDATLVAALEPIPRVDLTEEVVRRFKWLLAEGKLKPGGRLPPERELATLLGISRPSLRHGLKALELLGAIESRRRHGTFVSDSAGKVLEQPLALLVLLNATTFEELYEVRRTVEVELAALASMRATPAELDAIEACLAQQRASVDSLDLFLKSDLELHNLIGQAAHNTLFSVFLGSLRRLMSHKMLVLLTAPPTQVPRNVQRTIDEHAEIVRCLRAGDSDGARSAMVHHLESVYSQWLNLKAQSS
jgi:GntR family transcriptional repressor for pyruvate dehydrogenase complex